MSIRDKRLQSDYLKMRETFPDKGKIKILQTFGNPPDKYQIEFTINSLVLNPKGIVISKNKHTAEIYLTAKYPRQAPQCRMLTPVFHPNIAPHAICIGDHWAVGESLPHLVIRIAEMLAYQSYNLKSPLNGDAAHWTDKNRFKLPTDRTDFTSYFEKSTNNISESEKKPITDDCTVNSANSNKSITDDSTKNSANSNKSEKDDSTTNCANCNKPVKDSELLFCSSKHPVCIDCAFTCSECGKVICMKCDTSKCSICNNTICAQCIGKCSICQNDVCLSHSKTCSICNKNICDNCSKTCYICNKNVCDKCSITCYICGQAVCSEHMKKIPGTSNYACERCQP